MYASSLLLVYLKVPPQKKENLTLPEHSKIHLVLHGDHSYSYSYLHPLN